MELPNITEIMNLAANVGPKTQPQPKEPALVLKAQEMDMLNCEIENRLSRIESAVWRLVTTQPTAERNLSEAPVGCFMDKMDEFVERKKNQLERLSRVANALCEVI